MFCPNCGTNIPDGSRFCPKCGAGIDEETPGRQKSAGPAQENKTPDPGSTGQQAARSAPKGQADDSDSETRKNLTPRIIGIIIAAVVVVAIIVVLIVVLSNNGGGGGSAAVELDDYVDISVEGYNGYGTASYTFDTTSFVNDYAEKVAYKSADGKGEPSASAAQSLADRVADLGTFSKSEDLSNGDEIIFSWNFDAEAIEGLYEVTLKHDDFSYTVKDLEELEEVDVMDGGELDGNAFEGITVKFSGTSPQGTASIDTANSIDGVTPSMFTLSKSSWLANGDTVTVSITDEGLEELAEKCGITPTETEKEFKVEGLAYYPLDVSEIPEDSLKTAESRAYDDYYESLSNNWVSNSDDKRKLVSINNLGYYYYVNEETGANDLIFVYEVNAFQLTIVDNKDSITDPVKYYWFAYYSDIIVSEEGTWVVPSEHYTLVDMLGEDETSFTLEYLHVDYYGNPKTGEISYRGYQYLDEMNQDIKLALPQYTLVNDTVSGKEEEGTAPEENNETEEQAAEENNEAEGEAPEENNEGEQQEGE